MTQLDEALAEISDMGKMLDALREHTADERNRMMRFVQSWVESQNAKEVLAPNPRASE